MDVNLDTLSPIDKIMNASDNVITSPSKQYNTKWNRRARTLPCQSQDNSKKTVGSKKRPNQEINHSKVSIQEANPIELKHPKKSKIEVEASPQSFHKQ